MGLRSDVVVDYDRLRVIVRDRASDGRGPDGWSHIVGVAVRRVASVEIAGRQRAKSPTDASPNDRRVPRTTPVTRPTTVVPTMVMRVNAVVMPTVVPIVVGAITPVVTPVVVIVVVAWSIPEGTVVAVVEPVVVIVEVVEVIVVDVDVGIAVVPVGAVVVIAPIAPVTVAPVVVTIAPIVAVAVPVWSVPAAATWTVVIDHSGEGLDAARTVTATTETWSVGFGLRTCRQTGAVVGTVAAAEIRPIAVEVGPVSTAADVRAITTANVWSVAIEAWSWFGGGLTTRSTDSRQGSRTGRTDAALIGRTAKST